MVRFIAVTFVALVASAAALTTPHHARGANVAHASLAARLAEPAEHDAPVVRQHLRRAKRCPQRPLSSSSLAPAPTEHSSPASKPTAPINAAPSPSAPPPPPPKPTSSAPPAPKPTKTEAPKPPKSSPPAPAGPGVCGPRSLTGTMSGDGTFFATGLGACGKTTSDDDFIVAVSMDLYDTFPGAGANPNLNPVCGKKIEAHYQGKSVLVTVVDRCVGCACGALDFSPAAFAQLADFGVGRLHGVTWNYV